jgi:glycosyltransferase involved in cell wall biosynthesis
MAVPDGERGVSVVICCHNSASRLRPTLEHLTRQKVKSGVAWELIVVDNASTDGTAELARQCWRGDGPAPLRIVREPRPGLTAARIRGLRSARYDIVSFIDDDNWVCERWVSLVDEVMADRPDMAACGGYNAPVFESEPPAWFPLFQRRYAVGAQAAEPGDVTDTEGVLWGAGLSVRRSALLQLLGLGFEPLTTDRQGTSLSSGGDYEICFALRLAGHRLLYDARLQAKHFLPATRLEWRYLRRMARGSGASKVHRDPYVFLLDPSHRSRAWWWRTWWWQAIQTVRRLGRRPLRAARLLAFAREGDPAALDVDAMVGRLGTLLRERGRYDARVRQCHQIWHERILPARRSAPGVKQSGVR